MKVLRIVLLPLLIFIFSLPTTSAQECYWVFFRDKNNTTFDPATYFHPKVIERRLQQGLPLDVHVAREGKRNKEGTERNGIERPRGQIEVIGDLWRNQISKSLGEKSTIVVDTCRKGFTEQTEREDTPEGGFGKAVENHMLGGFLHAQGS